MKVYKLHIDASRRVAQVVSMQQNSVGLLSVEVDNDGKYIRNLSVSVFDGDTEISATTENGFKIDVGHTQPKNIKVKAIATPLDSVREIVVNQGSGQGTKSIHLNMAQIPAGTYNQDEFYVLAPKRVSNTIATFLPVEAANLSSCNFSQIAIIPWNPRRPVQFQRNGVALDESAVISCADMISCYTSVYVKRTGVVLSSYSVPTVGYYSDYSLDTQIRPDTNAPCWAEKDIPEPEPEPEQEQTPEQEAE